MEREVSTLLAAYEAGKLTRRQVVVHLAALGAAAVGAGGSVSAADEKPTFEAVGLNHIALRVTDVARSRDFYQEHLGLPMARQSLPGSCFLQCGPQFVALFQGDPPGMDHYCYSIPDYDQQEAARKLRAQGLEPRLAGNRIYFPDPDGLEVQLASPSLRA
jgi:catechol 2,3-dioxygenase-like lactoylglutathione lyase family enzyme